MKFLGAGSGGGTSGATSSIGGGTTTYYAKPSGLNADGSVAYTSGTTITVTGLPFTFTENDILEIKQIPTTGNVTSYTDIADISVSSGVITVAGATFGASDEFIVTMSGPDKAYSKSSDTQRIEEVDPLNLQYVTNHIVDSTNIAATTYRVEETMNGYLCGSLQWNISGGVTMTVWATNDDSADTSADTGWEDITSFVTGNASEVDNTGIAFLDTKLAVKKLMVKYITSDTSNAIDIFFNKAY